ncbi:MAG: sigma-70 family RNA polymerase sigma factor [Deltaproteobacteria bacterium]|nr:sigma-70 family RNA polymerase sigma factor [Deltaproteobacteria bacterium]
MQPRTRALPPPVPSQARAREASAPVVRARGTSPAPVVIEAAPDDLDDDLADPDDLEDLGASTPGAPAVSTGTTLTLAEIYDQHAAMVWRALRALGVPDDRMDDAVQDVFVVVHRRLAEFEARSALTTWLYGIARRVASDHRRRDQRNQTRQDEISDQLEAPGRSPFEIVEHNQAARLLGEILAELDDDRREVFVLMEVEQLSAPDVAQVLGVPLNTVYSRLRIARQRFEAALARRMPGGRP